MESKWNYVNDKNTMMNYIFYDSVLVHFSFVVFVEQLVLQLTYPFCFPYFVYKYGFCFLISCKFMPKVAILNFAKVIFIHFIGYFQLLYAIWKYFFVSDLDG